MIEKTLTDQGVDRVVYPGLPSSRFPAQTQLENI